MKTPSGCMRWLQRFAVGLAVLALVLPIPAVCAQQPGLAVAPAPALASQEPLLNRVVLIGASVTAGFSIAEPFGGPSTPQYRLKYYVESAIKVPHEPVAAHATAFFFTQPVENLSKQIKAAQEKRASAVIALDLLFWFCYGNMPSEQARLERFEVGLRLLEPLGVPILIGDIPDASGAVGRILEKAQMPDLATIAKCNERLIAWAAERKNVRIFPLAKLMAAASRNAELKLATSTWSAGESRALLQSDGLHPSAPGLAALTLEVMHIVASLSNPPLPENVLERDLKAVLAAAGDSAKEEVNRRAEEQRLAKERAAASASPAPAVPQAAEPAAAP